MPVIEVSSTDSDDGVLAAFRTIAPAVYATDSVWSPASEGVIDECLSRATSSDIAMRAVVASIDDRPVARAMGIANAGAAEGWVGMFECLPGSQEAGKAAIESCLEWLRSVGRTSVVGPRVDELRAGLLIEGFERPHTMFTAHNPPFYLDVFLGAGFDLRTRLVSFEFTRDRVPGFLHMPLEGVTLRSPEPSHFVEELERIEAFQESVFGAGLGRVQRSRDAGRRLARRLLPQLDLDLVVLAEAVDDTLIGVLVCVPDWWQQPPVDRARLISIGVAPGWRGRRIAMAMGAALTNQLLTKGYQTMEASWILADNTRPQKLARALGATPGRVFALLERGL